MGYRRSKRRRGGRGRRTRNALASRGGYRN